MRWKLHYTVCKNVNNFLQYTAQNCELQGHLINSSSPTLSDNVAIQCTSSSSIHVTITDDNQATMT